MPIDRVTLQILANHCGAATESMAHTLFRTAHSTFVKETEDFTTGLTTPTGETFATPTELGATPTPPVTAAAARVAEEILQCTNAP